MKPNKKIRKRSFSNQLENYQKPDRFGDWMGYEVVSVDKRKFKAELKLKIREDHLSPAGRVHGGVVSALFDQASGAAVFSTMEKDDFCSTVEIKVNYLKPFNLGDEIRVRMEVVFRGKRLCVVRGLAYKNREKSPAAMASATFNIISGK
jgi:acyl-CoA thioesterase